MSRLTCFFDVASPYCWFAFEELLKSVPKHNASLNFVPVHAASIMTSIGHKMPFYEKALRDYTFYDAKVQGRRHGLEIEIPDDAFEKLSNIGTFSAQRFLAAVKALDSGKYEDAARETWRRLWAENLGIHTDEDFFEIANKLNLSPEILNTLSDDKWTTAVVENNKSAIELNCFGVPWMNVTNQSDNNAVFFGSDRLPFVYKFLNSNF
uniref:Glutathione S-transferase kappa n=1 Tax=Panagrellus redivivus TaxID=6233 RepID=A0A7E4UYU0_PANRE